MLFIVGIEGIVGFKQDPEVIDPSEAGVVDLEIENLSKEPFKVLSVASNNVAYHLIEERFVDLPDTIEPGKSGRIPIWYEAQNAAIGASLDVILSKSITPSSIIRVPLRVKLLKESMR